MSTCDRAQRLQWVLARGETPDAKLRAHAASCSECSAVLRAGERLDAALERTMAAVVTEPLPPASALLEAVDRPRSVLPRVIGGLVAAAALAALIWGASVIGPQLGLRTGAGSPSASAGASPSSESIGSVPGDMAAWVAVVDTSILDHMDRHNEGDLALVRLERCGDIGLAFFADPRSPTGYPFVYGMGDIHQDPAGIGGGVAASLDEPEAAYARSQQPRPCVVVFDTVPDPDAILAAYLAKLGDDADQVTGVRVLATKLVAADVALGFINEVRVADGASHQQIAVLHRDGGAWVMRGAQGGEYPAAGAAVGVSPLGVAKGMPDDSRVAVGLTPDGAVAVELDFDGFVHRYPIDGGAFVILLPANTGFGMPYRLIDATGGEIASGLSQP